MKRIIKINLIGIMLILLTCITPKAKLNAELNEEGKGINVNEINISINSGETYDTELFFTEGSNKNLIFDISNKDVISIDALGIITALKPGLSYINISDKYNKYYAFINVIVDEEDYFNSLVNKVKETGIIIDGESYNSYDSYRPTYKMEELFSSALDKEINLYRFQYSANSNCDLDKMECTINLRKVDNQGHEIKNWNETFKISYSGIFLDEREVKLESNKDYTPTYTKYSDSELFIESNDTSICTVSNGVIHTLKEGICPVKYTVGNEVTYQFIIVDEDKIISNIQEQLNNIENTIIIKNDPYSLDGLTDQEKYEKQEFYGNQISEILKSQLNTNDLNLSVSVSFTSNTKINIFLNLNYNFIDEENKVDYFYRISSDTPISKTFELEYTGIPEEYKELGKKIKENIKPYYNLSLNQILKYQIDLKNGKNIKLDKYSSLSEDIKKICPECTYTFHRQKGIGDELGSHGNIIIYKDNYPIAYTEGLGIIFTKRFFLETEDIQSEELFIEKIKEEVKKSYLELKNIQNTNNEIKVEVKKEIEEILGVYYIITVEDLNFKTLVEHLITGNQEYDVDVTLTNSSPYVQIGKTIKLSYTKRPEKEVNESWRSLNESIVTVDQTGNITGMSLGETQVILNIEGVEYTYNVHVGERVLGDINNDGTVDNKDVFLAIKVVLKIVPMEDNYLLGGDTNLDGKITNTDIMYMIKKILKIVE